MRRIAIGGGMLTACLVFLVADTLPQPPATPPAKFREQPSAAADVIVVPDCRVRLTNEVQLASARTGILEMVVAEGEPISRGDVVARLHDELPHIGHAIAEREATNDIEVRFARKASELAQVKYIRAVDANKNVPGTVSELELRELRLAAEKSLLQIEQAQHQFLIAGLRRDEAAETLNTCRIAAPFDGIVLDVFKRPGEVVREGEVVLRLASGSHVRVEGFVTLQEAARLRRGMPVRVFLAADRSARPATTEPLPGRLALVDIKVEPVSRKVRIWADVDNSGGLLRDGLSAGMQIVPETTERPAHE
jgi:membrane fusion protein, multidrug efflux system